MWSNTDTLGNKPYSPLARPIKTGLFILFMIGTIQPSPYGQRRACRNERITERWNLPRRSTWSTRQRVALFDLPTDEAALLRHYTLSDDDIEQIRVRRERHDRLGFDLPSDLLDTVPRHRIARIRRQGERYFTDGLRDIAGSRRLGNPSLRPLAAAQSPPPRPYGLTSRTHGLTRD